MRLASIIAVSTLTLAFAACSENTPAAPAVDAAATEATTETAVAEALAKRDADAVALHGDAGPAVYFVNLRDGQTVPQSFRVVFGAYGIGVAPALVDKPNTGHHHLLIDTDSQPKRCNLPFQTISSTCTSAAVRRKSCSSLGRASTRCN